MQNYWLDEHDGGSNELLDREVLDATLIQCQDCPEDKAGQKKLKAQLAEIADELVSSNLKRIAKIGMDPKDFRDIVLTAGKMAARKENADSRLVLKTMFYGVSLATSLFAKKTPKFSWELELESDVIVKDIKIDHLPRENKNLPGLHTYKKNSVKVEFAEAGDRVALYNWITSKFNLMGEPFSKTEKSTFKIRSRNIESGVPSQTVELLGAWVSSISYGQIDYEGSNDCTIELEIVFDKVRRSKNEHGERPV